MAVDAGPVWSTACKDWQRRVVERETLIPFAPLFQASADDALEVFDDLQIVDAPGSPRMGDAARPWVRDFVSAIFGAYDPESGRRLIQEFFLLISKKNAKSTTAAGIMVTALVRNWRESGEFGILAPTIEVANNAYRPARDMIRRDPELSALMHVQDHIRTITHRGTGATLQVVAADTDAVSGKKWIGTFVDELWKFGEKSNAADMLLEATGGMASRPEGFVVWASTHSSEPPAGVFKQKLTYARKVRDGEIVDPAFLPVLYEFPPKMIASGAARDPANFYVTNPNLGASVDEAFLRRKLTEAQTDGRDAEQRFLAKHANLEVGLSLASDCWAGAEFWQAQSDETLNLEELLRRSEVVTIGIDGGGLDDLLGFGVVGRETGTGHWLHWGRAWAHPSVLERRKEVAPRLLDFAKDGDLSLVQQMGEDVEEVADIVEQIEASGLLDRIGVDPVGIGSIVDALTERKFDPTRIVGISQGWKMVGHIKTTERKLAEGALHHSAQPLMAWSVGNAKVEPRGNAVIITKQTAGSAKIDPLIALLNAVALMGMNPKPRNKKYQLLFA